MGWLGTWWLKTNKQTRGKMADHEGLRTIKSTFLRFGILLHQMSQRNGDCQEAGIFVCLPRPQHDDTVCVFCIRSQWLGCSVHGM